MCFMYSAGSINPASIGSSPPESIDRTASLPLPPLVSGVGIDGIAYRDRLISRQSLAHWLGISPLRLGIWAKQNYGPKPRRCGGVKVCYVVGEVLDFIQASTADTYPDVRRKARAKSKTETTETLPGAGKRALDCV